jgi:hypothetical protein
MEEDNERGFERTDAASDSFAFDLSPFTWKG